MAYARGRTPQERLLGLSSDVASGCRIWNGAKNNRGYGVMYFEGKAHLAHRVAFYLKNGRWPAVEKVTDHSCDVKACVNPDHLREMENWENLRRPYDRSDAERERQRLRWRQSNVNRRDYSPTYQIGGE